MSNGDSNQGKGNRRKCNCPFCGSENSILTTKTHVYAHPIRLRTYGFLHGIFFWDNRLPSEVEFKEPVCDNCKKSFYVQCWPHDPFHEDHKKKPVTNEKLFLEDILEKSHEYIKALVNSVPFVKVRGDSLRDMLILNGYLVGILFTVLMVAPAVLTGAGEKLFQDSYIIVTPIIFVLLLTSFQRQILIVHNSLLKFNALPVLLPEEYQKRTDYHQFNNTSIKRFFFGHHCKDRLKKLPHVLISRSRRRHPLLTWRNGHNSLLRLLSLGLVRYSSALFSTIILYRPGDLHSWKVRLTIPSSIQASFLTSGIFSSTHPSGL